MNAVVSASRSLPAVFTPVPDTAHAETPRLPMAVATALDQCLRAGHYGPWHAEPTCGGDGFHVIVERGGTRGDCELVRLAEGVWLLSCESRLETPMAAWQRHRGSLAFTVMLRGGYQFAAARTPGERFIAGSGCGVVGAHAADMVGYAQPFVGVTNEWVSLVFRDAHALRHFGLELEKVCSYLAAPVAGRGDQSAFAVCTAERAALEAAHAIREAPYDGTLRHLYLKGKACELLAHLLASRMTARSAAESQELAGRTQAGIAAMVHAALIDAERQPTASGIAQRLRVTEGQVLRAFKATYGTSLHEYAARVRMKRGRQLLLQTRIPLIEVALACGYEHHSSFSTAYLRTYGETPVQTRRSALQPV